MSNAVYADTKATLEAVQRLPEEARRAILTMLRGAIVISDLCLTTKSPEVERWRGSGQDSA